jgi:hypothetical protein
LNLSRIFNAYLAWDFRHYIQSCEASILIFILCDQ